MPDYPHLQPKSRSAWRTWLQKNHARSTGVWLVIAKRHSGIPSLTYNDAVEEALCFGWIDSLVNPIDERLYKQVFTPRKPKSMWSLPNKQRIERMIAAGLMTAVGMALITAAKKSGTWNTLDHVDALTPPPELQAALDKKPKAAAAWAALRPGAKKLCLYSLLSAKRPETRAKRVAEIIAQLTAKPER
jgi:uncharacterized protein YdeI (YjbR/CyaY-like superfamily)